MKNAYLKTAYVNIQKESGALIYQSLHLAKALPFTETSMKIDALSVKLSEILDRLVEQYCRLKKVVFIHCKLKMPDKISRKRADFVRHFI